MKIVRVTIEFDHSRVIGAFQFNPKDLPPGNDWVLAPATRRFRTAQGFFTEVTTLGLIDVRQHPLFPKPSGWRYWLTYLRRLLPRLRRHSE